MSEEIRLTVGELREILDRLPSEAEIAFGCPQATPLIFCRLRGEGENRVLFEFSPSQPGIDTRAADRRKGLAS